MNRVTTALFGTALLLLGASQCIGEETKPGPDYEQLKAMEWMIGDWEADWVVPSGGNLGLDGFPSGAKVHSTCSYFWMENKNYVGLKFRDEIDGEVAHQGFEIVGVDPGSKKIVHWLFSTLGGWGRGEWTVEGKTWKLKWWGTTADGTKLEGVSYMVPLDSNTHTWEIKDNKRNGKSTSDTPLVTYRRISKQEKPKSVASPLASGQGLTEEQKGPWSALEEQVGLDIKQDWKGTEKFMHPKGCFWGDTLPAPVSMKSEPYYEKLREGEDEAVAHHLIPVSVVVVDDVAIINFYLLLLTRTEDDNGNGKQVEKVYRGHNTWKKEKDRWLLLSTYNTMVETKDDD